MLSDRIAGWAAAVLVVVPLWARAQTAASSKSGPRVLLSSPASAASIAQGEIVREIDDPHLGNRWLLKRDPSHPGGPGLLLLVSAHRAGSAQPGQPPQTTAPVIHLGDRVVVEEHTPVVDARLEAVALNPAMAGSALHVRLTVGGRTMQAVALAPGRAAFAGETRR
jgi:hypothetical protein